MFLKTDGAGNLSFSSDLPTTSFTGATAETSIAGGDLVLIYDDSATAVRKMTKANLVAGIGATAGQVIQVKSATNNTNYATTSTSFVSSSNTMSVTITPSSTANKIYVIASTCIHNNTNETYATATIYRDSTNLGNGNLGMGSVWGSNTSKPNVPMTMHYLDSPSSTSALTYQVRYRAVGAGTAFLNGLDGNNQGSITVFEIKG